MSDLHFSSDGSRQSALVKRYGLFNHGATCYLNSVLQVLFRTRDFREAVERYAKKNSENQHIDHQLKALFDELKQRCANTFKINRKLGINKAHEQRDAAEYFEKILSLTSPEASRIFHGELTHRTQCSKCGKKTNANGHFWHLPLELVDANGKHLSVVDSIEQYFQTSHFNGENQMYCEKCDSKSDATIKCQTRHHPEVLTLLLKRFDFDYDHMTHVKNDCAVDVPFTLHIPENQTYELYAVVEHFGDLKGGHYTATIKDNERWYNFNDATVELLDRQPFETDKTEKYHNAYLLFYRKKTTDMQDTSKRVTNKGLPSATGRHANIKPKYGMEEKTVLFHVEPGHEVVKTRHSSLERNKKSEGNESGRRRASSTRQANWDERHRNMQGLDSEAGKWKSRQGSEIQTVDEDKYRRGVRDGKDAKTSANKPRNSKRHDSYHDGHGHRQLNVSTDDPRGKEGPGEMLERAGKARKGKRREDEEPGQFKRSKMTNSKQEDENDPLTEQINEIKLSDTELETNPPKEKRADMGCCTRGAYNEMMKSMKKKSWWGKQYCGCFLLRKRKKAVKQK